MSLRHSLLGLLALKPSHGYDLHASFTALAGGCENWDVKPAQVYTTLSRLKETGMVEDAGTGQDGGPEKRKYRLTPLGKGELAQWFESAVDGGHLRDEFFIKLMLALAGPGAPGVLIQSQRRHLFQELHRLTLKRDSLDPGHSLAQMLLLEKAIAHGEADLRWLDRVELHLDEIQNQPMPVPENKMRGRPKLEK